MLCPAMIRAVLLAAASLMAHLTAGPAVAEPAPRLAPLPSLKGAEVTVSGLSSGGFFAHQMHVAYSSRISGAGIVAGGPFGCAEQFPAWLSFNPARRLLMATVTCSTKGRGTWWDLWLPRAPSGEAAADAVRAAAASGSIDDPRHLAGSRVWLFWGVGDHVVPPDTMRAVRAAYERLGVAAPALEHVERPDAAHGLPVQESVGEGPFPRAACGAEVTPYLIDCGFDAAASILGHLHRDPFDARPQAADPARFARFDQGEFTRRPISLGEAGTLYVPGSCAGAARCRLHVVFHGCHQTEREVGDVFTRHAGYNEYAHANGIVVLYPQVVIDPAVNPEGCWDWWGYTGTDYETREGPQMRAVRAMILRLTGE